VAALVVGEVMAISEVAGFSLGWWVLGLGVGHGVVMRGVGVEMRERGERATAPWTLILGLTTRCDLFVLCFVNARGV